MAITLGNVTFDEARTKATETFEEVGGGDARIIELSGLITGENSVPNIEAKLDEIIDAASSEDYSAELSLRPGRRLNVRRKEFKREVLREQLVGSFGLLLESNGPFEESTSLTQEAEWTVTSSGATKNVTAGGNVYSLPNLSVTADGTLVYPSISDGTHTITYSGTLALNDVLVFDSESRTATLNGTDVTPYTTGLFPRILPSGTTLTYTDDAASSHLCRINVSHRDRWW